MGAASKRAKRQRSAGEFDIVRLAESLKAPPQAGGIYAWDVESIRGARSAQLTGQFTLPARLSASMKTDDALYTALRNRLSPIQSLPSVCSPANATARAKRIADEGDALFGPMGVAVKRTTVGDLNECLAEHGIAIGVNVFTPRLDGARVDIEHKCWPIEHVRWNQSERRLETRLANGGTETICHADGRWTVYADHDIEPWRWGAVVPAALVWMDRAFGIRDRSRASTSHGNAKMIGELPQGIAINSEEGAAFLLLLKTMHDALPYGIRPAGSKTEMMVNTSTAWQVFKEIVDSRLSDAARIYLGHDGTIKSAGGNYVKDGYLYGVSSDIVEGDLRTIERGIFEGVIQPWAALNFGVSDLAPMKRWLMPDPDNDARHAATADRRAKFWDEVEQARAQGADVDQAWIDELAKEYGIKAPRLKVAIPNAHASASPASPPSSPAAPAPGPTAAALRPIRVAP